MHLTKKKRLIYATAFGVLVVLIGAVWLELERGKPDQVPGAGGRWRGYGGEQCLAGADLSRNYLNR